MDLTAAGRVLVLVGLLLVALGVFLALGGRLPVGRLPGDVAVSDGSGGGFYLPLVSCILLSVVLTVVINLVVRR